jgi:uncharacterized protein YndB with AHSA1/START domain
VIHGSFSTTRSFAAAPDRVFAAFADRSVRRQWFGIPGRPANAEHELDFRVGGRELVRGTFEPSGVPEHIEYRSRFFDIVADERIVFASELLLDGRRRSVSLVTVELSDEAGRTRLTYTEQYVFLVPTGNGHTDAAEREGGTRLQLNGLAAVLEGATSEGRV